jgi:Predicted membrane protein
MNTYLLFKAIHLIAVISWMAGLLYLPRIFVYHSETSNNEDKINTFKTMERRLYFYIMNPAMLLSWIFGLLLLHSIGLKSLGEFWLITKLILMAFLTLYHLFLFFC